MAEYFRTKQGSIVFSIIIGLGLASLFRQVCKGSHCVVVKGPNSEEIANHVFKNGEDCFKYTPVIVDCDRRD